MPVEFLGIAATNDGSETGARTGGSFDKDYTLRLALAHEEHGWDRVLFAYGSGSPDPNAAAVHVADRTQTLQLLLAHRPNVSYPPSRPRPSPRSTRSAGAGWPCTSFKPAQHHRRHRP